MNCIVVEDQTPAQRILMKYIADHGALNLLSVFSDPVEALSYLEKNHIDLIFLDIHLPKISGIDFLKSIKHVPQVILTTAFSEYAVQSYELDVADYLVKPFSFERFVKAVAKAVLRVDNYNTGKTSAGISLFIKTGREFVKISSAEIAFIHSDMDYTEIHLLNGNKILSTDTLASWENRLAELKFYRVHKSYLINLQEIEKVSANQILLSNNEIAPIGRAYKAGLMKDISQLG